MPLKITDRDIEILRGMQSAWPKVMDVVNRVLGMNGPTVHNTPQGIVVSARNDPPPRQSSPPASGGGESKAKLVYITADLTCGGVYEGYIVSDLAGLMVSAGFSSGSSTFALSDILYDAPGIAGSDAEKITIINDDEEGLATHALTAATQIKHLYIAFDTGNTDDDESDRRVFLITDSDSKECV